MFYRVAPKCQARMYLTHPIRRAGDTLVNVARRYHENRFMSSMSACAIGVQVAGVVARLHEAGHTALCLRPEHVLVCGYECDARIADISVTLTGLPPKVPLLSRPRYNSLSVRAIAARAWIHCWHPHEHAPRSTRSTRSTRASNAFKLDSHR